MIKEQSRAWAACASRSIACGFFVLACLLFPSRAFGQDLFEIQVYPYDTVPPYHTMVEFHMNYFPSGTRTMENGEFPKNHQIGNSTSALGED